MLEELTVKNKELIEKFIDRVRLCSFLLKWPIWQRCKYFVQNWKNCQFGNSVEMYLGVIFRCLLKIQNKQNMYKKLIYSQVDLNPASGTDVIYV